MAELLTLARPYAKAAFEAAVEAKDLGKWSKMLSLSTAVTVDKRVANLIASPALSSDLIAQSVIDICGDELDEKAQNFIKLLVENKRINLLPEIFSLFEDLKAAQEKSVDVEITTPFEIPAAISDKLVAALTARLQREINLTTSVDTHLIGGAVIRAGDMVIDSSVRGKLNKLAEAMSS
ncbi:MAG: F0F1 ATP synthase subunit delta [SAR86 cluster bacterium]|uniref:ATP synthase subunit delta n=1 Tax=SAR86 cluster bacterium TaxID=2030880 RepID=A0A2A4MRL9_9GAMM|nr:MAG: F0F1 ATP synthase subunit delta [SAR86 cluster bacterium]